MYMICYGNVVDGFTFTGPFMDHDSALAYCEGDDDQWNIVEMNSPNESSESVFDLLGELVDVLNDAADSLNGPLDMIKRLRHFADKCATIVDTNNEEGDEDDAC